jgi:hypothetical protein
LAELKKNYLIFQNFQLHLKFKYNHKKSLYQIVDVSKNGTILNGLQISNLNQGESEAQDLIHGSILEVCGLSII